MSKVESGQLDQMDQWDEQAMRQSGEAELARLARNLPEAERAQVVQDTGRLMTQASDIVLARKWKIAWLQKWEAWNAANGEEADEELVLEAPLAEPTDGQPAQADGDPPALAEPPAQTEPLVVFGSPDPVPAEPKAESLVENPGAALSELAAPSSCVSSNKNGESS